jgi:hypothetical protein
MVPAFTLEVSPVVGHEFATGDDNGLSAAGGNSPPRDTGNSVIRGSNLASASRCKAFLEYVIPFMVNMQALRSV